MIERKKKKLCTHPVSAENRRGVRVVEVRVEQPQVPRLHSQLGRQRGLVDAHDGGAALGVDLEPAAAGAPQRRAAAKGGRHRERGGRGGRRRRRGRAGGEGPPGRASPCRVVRRSGRLLLLLLPSEGQRRQRGVRGEEAAGARRAAERRRRGRSCRRRRSRGFGGAGTLSSSSVRRRGGHARASVSSYRWRSGYPRVSHVPRRGRAERGRGRAVAGGDASSPGIDRRWSLHLSEKQPFLLMRFLSSLPSSAGSSGLSRVRVDLLLDAAGPWRSRPPSNRKRAREARKLCSRVVPTSLCSRQFGLRR